MKQKGFTLIELLAVITVLAIIALIATPIFIGIINSSKAKILERSVDLYAEAVKNAIVVYRMQEEEYPADFSELVESGHVKYRGDVQCDTQYLNEDFSFYLSGCTVNGESTDYSFGTKNPTINNICTLASDSTVTGVNKGAKYNCKVDPNKEAYTFFVLNTPAEGENTVNLIMNSNITINGDAIISVQPKTTEEKGLVAWISADDYGNDTVYGTNGKNDKGPITAMNHLQKATKSWTNLIQTKINSFDVCDSANNCTNKSMNEYNVYARLPYKAEISDFDGTNAYLYNYLAYYGEMQTNTVNGVWGYWFMSASKSASSNAYYANYNGRFNNYVVSAGLGRGVRPVITVGI